MAKRGGNVYKRKDGRWEGRIAKDYNEKGKIVYAYFYGHSCKEVKDKIFNYSPYIQGYLESNEIEGTPRFNDILNVWLKTKEVRLKKSSYVKYFKFVDKHIRSSLGDYIVTDISNAVLTSYILEKRKAQKHGLSERTIKDILKIIKSVLRFAQKEGILSASFNVNFTFPSEKPKEMRVFTKEEQTALEKYLCSDLDVSKLGVLLCLYTGLRIGEICALKWGDIALEQHTLTVNQTVQRVQNVDEVSTSKKTEVIFSKPKSGCSSRTIPLPECLVEKLKAFKIDAPNTYFLTGETWACVEPRTYQNRFKQYVNKSGIKDANFHSTRHTFATRCVELGFDLKSLSEILGHANVTITLNLYVHPSFESKRKNMNKLTYMH